jgi:predicted HTH domain antitoxin
MTTAEIIDLFDSNPDITLAQLARMSGRTVAEIKQILMEE